MKLAKVLTDGEKCDIDEQELYQELLILPSMLPSGSSPANVGEQSFSQLMIIKNYLRSTMYQERSRGLATVTIENY
ncbi:hypothetical protein PR048_023487, partial [Dryococelus australis]